VLEFKVPAAADLEALRPLVPVFLTYVLSFVVVGTYWNNHHHLLRAAEHIDGRVLWANLHLLFWLSLVPFVTGWMGENHFAAVPTAVYGVVLLMCGVAYRILVMSIVALGMNAALSTAIGSDFKGKISLVLYAAAIPLAFVNLWISDALFISVTLVWLIPDRRIERTVQSERV